MKEVGKALFMMRVRGWLRLIPVLLPIIGIPQAHAQGNSPPATVSVAGKIASLKGPDLVVSAAAGEVLVKTTDQTPIRGEVPISLSEITPGMYVGVTAAKQPDGMFRASRLHIFAEDQRGIGEGHRPLSSSPQSGLTMTNANVETAEDMAVQEVKGRMLTLKYKGGEIKVFVPPGIPVVRRMLGDQGWLKPGAEVSIRATQAADGSLSASQITVRASGTK